MFDSELSSGAACDGSVPVENHAEYLETNRFPGEKTSHCSTIICAEVFRPEIDAVVATSMFRSTF